MGSIVITVVLTGLVFGGVALIPWFLRRMVGVVGDVQTQRDARRLRQAEIRKVEAEADLAVQQALNAQLNKGAPASSPPES
jgi:hypothetical protein